MKAYRVLLVLAVALLAGGAGLPDEFEIVEALHRAKVTPEQAIHTAEKQAAARPLAQIEIGVLHDGTPVWEPAFYEGVGKLHYVQIDAISGKTILTMKERQTKPSPEPLPEARITFKQAMDLAHKEVRGGKAWKVKLGTEKGKAAYEVCTFATDKRLRQVQLDALTGKLLSVEDQAVVLGWWSFDDVPMGKLPDNWVTRQNNPTQAMAIWGVAAAPDAPTPPNVLNVQTENANATYNMVLAQDTPFKDLDVRTQIRGNTGKDDQGGGLIWRAKDENNYYICRINPLEPNYRVYKVEAGKRTQLQSAEVKTETGKWYTLRAVMVGNHITCYLDRQKVLEVDDNTFKDAGTIGLWTKADASSSFDDVIVLQAKTGGPAKRSEKGGHAHKGG